MLDERDVEEALAMVSRLVESSVVELNESVRMCDNQTGAEHKSVFISKIDFASGILELISRIEGE